MEIKFEQKGTKDTEKVIRVKMRLQMAPADRWIRLKSLSFLLVLFVIFCSNSSRFRV